MSGVAVARYLLANNSALIAVVAADKIKPGAVPINTVLPAIAIRQISGIEQDHIKRGANQMITERVQISVYALTYSTQKSILALIRAALPGTRATINGFAVDSIVPDIEGPDFYTEAPVIFEQSADYFIRFIR